MVDLKSLNPEQKQAVTYNEGPHIVVAGAGSGKTRVLTHKIAYLIEHGYDPQTILSLTFTNKAAKEMQTRIKSLIGSKADYLWMGTFHSVFCKILRIEAEAINYTRNFSIYDTDDSLSLVQNIINELNIATDTINPSQVRHRISYLKNLMIDPDTFRKGHIQSPIDEKIADIYARYKVQLEANNAMDFEDLLLKPLELFERNKKILAKYKKKFEYLLVDEFQDTNVVQYELLKQLVAKDGKICLVGDDAQSIYSWRGAEVKNMLNFTKDYPKAKTFRLERNYRSTKTILGAADSVIKNNSNQIPKTLWTENEEGDLLSLVKCTDEKDEAYQIARIIKEEIHSRKLSLKDFAVFYRTNAQSRAMEDVFTRERLPYVIIGGIEFYKRKEVKDIVAYLKVLTNQKDEESLLRIMNFPQRGIGMTTINRMIAFARKHNITLFETMSRVFEVIDIKERIQKNVKNFKLLLDRYIQLKSKLSISELVKSLVDELNVLSYFREEKNLEAMERADNIDQLLASIMEYNAAKPEATLEEYIQEVTLITDLEFVDDKKNVVTLMTVHSAKGLEFPVVFVSGLEEEIFPLANRFSAEASVEEERRLFYVALTRAEKRLFLSHARSRYRFGEVAYQSRSRFIEEIDHKFIEEEDGAAGRRANRKSKREMYYEYFENVEYIDFSQKQINLKIGTRVMHEKFGLGKIAQVVGAGDNQRVTVIFEGNNVKQLMLKFAKLKVLNN
ncbi:MAG: UvrD-helicase domain-containing protein [Ignavibacteria bacterium]|nr:UvrD-helicase domain-containing protein [Ignavibacteria bacterium]